MDPKSTRRRFLTNAALLPAMGLPGVLSAGGIQAQTVAPMLTRPIPSTGEKLPVIGFGTWQTFDIGDEPAAFDQRREVLDILFAAGGKVIDSSPMYRRAEAVVGRLLTDMKARDKAFLATKVWTTGEAAGRAQMQASASKMQTAVIDLMQVHNLVDWRTHMRTLRAWKEKGQFRYIGLTHYTDAALDDLADIIRTEQVDFLQFGYSINDRVAERRLLPLAAEKGVAVIANQPFDSGSVFGKVRGKTLPAWASEVGAASWAQFFLKYILASPAVTCAIPGTARPEHARDNVAAGEGIIPDAAQQKRMAAFWDGV